MKKILSAVLVGTMLLTSAAAVFAEDEQNGLALTDSSHLKLDRESGYIDMIDGTITAAELKENFATDVTVTSPDGEARADDADVATDDVVTAGDDSIKALIYGDADRNGKINLSDVSAMLKYAASWNIDISEAAADVDKNDEANVADVSKLLKYLAGWDNISLGNVRMIAENVKQTAEHEDATIDMYFTSMMNKTAREVTESTGEYVYKMKLARNETESCQVILAATENKEGLTAELSPFEYEFGGYSIDGEIEWIYYYSTSVLPDASLGYRGDNQDNFVSGDYPEVVLPMAESFELTANRAQHMVISVTTGKDAPAGMYRAVLDIKDSEGQVIKTAYVYAYVWDFTLPDAPYSASLFCNASYGDSTYEDYYNYLLDYNLSSYILPYDITDSRADAYMSDPRVTAFVIAGGGHMYGGIMGASDEDTIARYNKVMSNPEWAKKGLFYYTDEPYGAGLVNVKTTYEYVTNLLGTTDIRNITPLAANNSYVDEEHQAKGIDPVEYISPYINVWCPQSPAFHLRSEGGTWSPARSVIEYGEFVDRAAAFRERGDEIWWYVCCSPDEHYANLFTWYQGVVIRDFMWQQYFNDVDGQLYYSVSQNWDSITKYKFDIANGDGTLLFPGEKFGFSGPCASWRLIQLRDGFDDFDYLSMAEELVGRDAVMKVVNKVTTGMLEYTADYKVVEAARDEIAKLIVDAQ